MKMQAVYVQADKTFRVGEFPLRALEGDEVLIRTHYSGISVGAEFTAVRGTRYYGEYPFVLGYQGTGVIAGVGPQATRFKEGDPVYFRRNALTLKLGGVTVHNRNGAWASHVIHSEKRLVEPLPAGVDGAAGAMFVMPAVGLNAVDMAGVRMGDYVAVQGVGLIGLGAVAACFLRGAKPIAIDLAPQRLRLAAQFGAVATLDPAREDAAARVQALTGGRGADVAVEATGVRALVDQAIALCRPHGKFIFLAVYGEAPLETLYMPAHHRRLTAYYPCDDGQEPCREAVLHQMAVGALRWRQTISHRVAVDDMPAFCARVLAGEMPELLGAVIDWQAPDPL